MKRLLVLGGTGFVGRSLCARLAARAADGCITVPTRHASHGREIRLLPTVQVHTADVHDLATLRNLVAGHDAVVNLVAILHGSAAAFERVHVQLPRLLAQACHDTGVRRLVHVSALGVGSEPAAAPSNYLRTKTVGELVLQQADLRLTVLRPSVIFGAEDRFMNLFARLQGLAPVLPLAGGAARFQPVWVEDVTRGIVAALERPDSIGRCFECVGPDVLTLSELVRLAGRWSGHERPQIPLPEWAGRLQALLMEMLPGEPLMSRDNIDSMRVPNVSGGVLPGLPELGITPRPLAAVAPDYLGPDPGASRLDRMRSMAQRD